MLDALNRFNGHAHARYGDPETLTRIARRYYGNGDRWVEIYDANRASLPNPASLTIGMKLRIP